MYGNEQPQDRGLFSATQQQQQFPQGGYYPPQQGGYYPQQGGYPPQQGYGQQQGYPPPQGGYYPQQQPMMYQQGQRPQQSGGGGPGVATGCMAALCACCCLEALF